MALTWNQIAETLANALGVQANIVHIPSDVIATYDAAWGAGLFALPLAFALIAAAPPRLRETIPNPKRVLEAKQDLADKLLQVRSLVR